ncbi:hypothetical protein BCR36DRAFT_409429 [Piromyces finnis]|uniref:DUF4476 domain-containing protein n=1 Tax=Piromyces finnis TaxID=1754191 RepID=A0A1Y1VI77_9FUNG|nr:hypothetical protein BCR36DRAFT_409429 [Piromyces finnis]|eukprot:ORX57105.1 hypothetical protein BCR36DRAFT_409429 [Piromyces finnis]
MESEFNSEKELQQLQAISEKHERLFRKIEELEKKDNEEEKKLKCIQNNINNLLYLIHHSTVNNDLNVETRDCTSLKLNTIPSDNPQFNEMNISTKNKMSLNIPINNDIKNNTINEILESRESKILFTKNEFEEFIGKIIEAPSSIYREKIVIDIIKKNYIFSIQQIGEILNLLPYMSEKKSFLKIIKNSIHDYYHKQDLMKYLNEETEEQKQEICNILF